MKFYVLTLLVTTAGQWSSLMTIIFRQLLENVIKIHNLNQTPGLVNDKIYECFRVVTN